jgi:two-component system, chemotaxis family, response regulator PixG
MTLISSSDDLIIREFISLKQIKFFKSLQEARITGKLTFINRQKNLEWYFYLYLGQIMYATGGEHPFRRWQRHINSFIPEISFNLIGLEQELGERIDHFGNSLWEYDKLFSLLETTQITRQQASNFIWSIVSEVLFDVTQGREILCTLEKDPALFPLLDLIEPQKVIEYTDEIWQEWQKAKIADRSPNLAVVILQPKQLQEKITGSIYEDICQLLDTNKTLRDLAIYLKASPLKVTKSLVPYIQSGVLDLISIADLLSSDNYKPIVSPLSHKKPLIACIDDSMMTSHVMEEIISVAGYRFLGINDPVKAIAELSDRKPDLIFLDIVMPNINGYELCAELRKHPTLAKTPIIFLTSNDGIVDRLRAKMTGASDFLTKTVDADRVLKMIIDHLPTTEET